MVKNDSKTWVIVVVVAIVVAVIASLITANITGNIIKVQKSLTGPDIYTKMDIDKMNFTTMDAILNKIEDTQKVHDISLSDAGWDKDGDGYTSGEEVCNSERMKCLLTLAEFDNGGTAGKFLEPLTCRDKQPINVDETTIDILRIWCVNNPFTAACGNNVLDGNEVCDGTSVSRSCQDFGYGAGTLGCCAGCEKFDLSKCYNVTLSCRDNDINSGTDQILIASNATYGISHKYGPSCNGGTSSGGGGGGVLKDRCFDSDTVEEAICNSDRKAILTNMDCPKGYVCKDNRCIGTGWGG